MQHPDVPQHLMDLDLPSSSMRFLRGEGPDIELDQLLIEMQSDDSSSSSDASFVPDRARFLASLQHYATISLFHRRGIPSPAEIGSARNQQRTTIAFGPILVDRLALQNLEATPAPSGMEIVPWRPCLHAIALQLLPNIMEARNRATHTTTHATMVSEGVIILGENSPQHAVENGAQGLENSGPVTFEF